MNVAFIVTIDTDAVDPQSLLALADDMHTALEGEFDVVDVKNWARPTIQPTQPQPTTGLPPVSGGL